MNIAMRTGRLALAGILLAHSWELFASADLRVMLFSADKTSIFTGDRFTTIVRVRNDGPDSATDVVVQTGHNGSPLVIASHAPTGWKCDAPFHQGAAFACRIAALGAGTEAELRVTYLAPPRPIGIPWSAVVGIAAASPDPHPSNNGAYRSLQLVPSPNQADLSLTEEHDGLPAASGYPVGSSIEVRNAGPHAAHNVLTLGTLSGAFGVHGRDCSMLSSLRFICRSSVIPAGESDRIEIFFDPSRAAPGELTAHVIAEGNHDPAGENDRVDATVTFGPLETTPEGWERILLPVFAPAAKGAYGSEFRSILLFGNKSATERVPVRGLRPDCLLASPPCDAGPVEFLWPGESSDEAVPDGTPGLFLYVGKAGARHVILQLRVVDTSRSAESFGTEIPVVSESDMFRDEPIHIGYIPTDPRFRNRLRIYATTATTVTVTVGSQGDVTHHIVALRPGRDAFEPAYAELAAFPVGPGGAYVTIEPSPGELTEPPWMWAFVTVTNNETQQITTLSPWR